MNRCKEHSRLTLAIADAGAKVHASQRVLEEAKRTNVDLVPPMAFLEAARSERRHAVAALSEHEELHGCVPVALSNPASAHDYEVIRADAQHALVGFLQATLKAGFIAVQSALVVKNEGRTDHFVQAKQNARKTTDSVQTFINLVKDLNERRQIKDRLSELERLIATL
jgi:hypothetical protein